MLAAKFDEVHGVSGNPYGELRVFFRMLHGIFQHLPVQDVDIQVMCAFPSIMVTRFSTFSWSVGPSDFGTIENVLLIPSIASW